MSKPVIPLLFFLLSSALTSCGGFVRKGTGVSSMLYDELSVSELDSLILNIQSKQREGLRFYKVRRSSAWPTFVTLSYSWEEALAKAYAARSTCQVRHVPIVTITQLAYVIGKDGACLLSLAWAFAIPLDLLGLPLQLASGLVKDFQVPHEVVCDALADLQIAREIGYSNPYADFTFWGIQTKHIDTLGLKCSTTAD